MIQLHTATYLESDGILRRSGEEVVWNSGRIVVLGDFDGQRIATGMGSAVANEERPDVLQWQNFQRNFPA